MSRNEQIGRGLRVMGGLLVLAIGTPRPRGSAGGPGPRRATLGARP